MRAGLESSITLKFGLSKGELEEKKQIGVGHAVQTELLVLANSVPDAHVTSVELAAGSAPGLEFPERWGWREEPRSFSEVT